MIYDALLTGCFIRFLFIQTPTQSSQKLFVEAYTNKTGKSQIKKIKTRKMIRNSLFFDVQVFIHTLSVLVALASSLTIVFILFLFCKNRQLFKNYINIFILNIIVNDLLKCIIYIPIVNISFHTVLEMIRNYSDGIKPAENNHATIPAG